MPHDASRLEMLWHGKSDRISKSPEFSKFYDTGFDNFLIYFAAGHNGPDELI